MREKAHVLTPYALKALEQGRINAGRERRKSESRRRETPRDTLRTLSKGYCPINQFWKSILKSHDFSIGSVQSRI